MAKTKEKETKSIVFELPSGKRRRVLKTSIISIEKQPVMFTKTTDNVVFLKNGTWFLIKEKEVAKWKI